MEDQSGIADAAAWEAAETHPAVVRGLLGEIGRVYVPVLLANERAVARGDALVEAEVDGLPWQQNPFPYHVKCLAALRGLHAGLADGERRIVDDWLVGTGVERIFGS
jgi:hypothetical protein